MASAGTALLAPSPARSSPISALVSSTSLVVTIRHLPSDRWLTFSAPKEWRIGQLKDAALVAFGESPPSQPPRRSLPLREPVVDAFRTPRAGRRREGIVGEELAKENEVPDDRATKRRSSGGGGLRSVGRVASAMASKIRPLAVRSPRTRSFFSSDSVPPVPPLPLRPPSPLPPMYELSSNSSSARSSLSVNRSHATATPPRTPTAPSARTRRAPRTLRRATSRSSLPHGDMVATPVTPRAKEGGFRALGFGRAPSPSPAGALWPEYTPQREKLRSSPVPTDRKEAKSRRREGAAAWEEDVSERDKKEPGRWSEWCLVSAIKGGFGPDRGIVGTHLVEYDLLILKPRVLDYDPPLHLLHLPFLRIERVEVLVRLQDDLSFGEPERSTAPSTLKKRESLVGPKPQFELCEQTLEICVEGVTGWSGWNDDEVEGPIMVLRLHQDGQLVQVHCLPACSIRLDSPEPASPVLSPCTPTARKPVPAPSARSVVPLIHLDFDDGERLVFRPSSLDDYERVMRLVDNDDARSEAAFEAEMKRRMNIIDTAYRAWHVPLFLVPLASVSTRPPEATAAPAHVLPLSPLLSNMPIERRRSLNSPPPSSSCAESARPGLVKSFTQTSSGRQRVWAGARGGRRRGRFFGGRSGAEAACRARALLQPA